MICMRILCEFSGLNIDKGYTYSVIQCLDGGKVDQARGTD